MIFVLDKIKKITDIPKEIKLFKLFRFPRHKNTTIKLGDYDFVLNDSQAFVFGFTNRSI